MLKISRKPTQVSVHQTEPNPIRGWIERIMLVSMFDPAPLMYDK